MTKQVRGTMEFITLKNGSAVVGKTTEIFRGKRLTEKKVIIFFNCDIRVANNCARREKNDFTTCYFSCSN
jgi:hypothetical protein